MAVDAARAKSLFLAASDLADMVERSAYLGRECDGDAELRGRVEALLRANDAAPLPPQEAGDGTSEFAADRSPPTEDYGDPTARVGSIVAGKYKLIEEIGEGGMGSVYMAQQTEPVKRAVAVKVIKAGMDSKAVLARFEAERQALAMMDHPNIAKVLDAGTTEGGRPFFVMELVKGTPITQYCDERKLTPRQRLELFVPVCMAIQHAHQKGIIHRDIKPSNVLVAMYDDHAVPKVIDFGVAKASGQSLTDMTLMTGLGAVVGTAEYMSPEQANLNNLDIDTRSDVYSLGVLLYELLTGTTPVDRKSLGKAAFLEVLRIVREVEAPKPSAKLSTIDTLPSVAANRSTEPAKLSKLMKGELDWVLLKALEKDRTRRYETANGLARDIQRYLSDEPVEACPPSATYRLRKFARKNRAALTTATIISLLLLSGIAVSTWQAVRASRAEHAALDARDAEAEQRIRAEDNEKRARAAVVAEKTARETAEAREAESKAVLEFVENKVFAAARPKGQEGGQGHEVKLADAITAALPYVETSFTDQPLIEARLRGTLGLSFWYLGKADVAEQQFRRARDLFTAKLGPDHHHTLMSMNNLAGSYEALGRHQEALALNQETLKLWKAKLGPDNHHTLKSMTNLASNYNLLGRYQEALTLYEETLKLKKAKLGPDHRDTLICMIGLANSYSALGRHSEALALREETLELRKAKLGPDHPDTLLSMGNLAISYETLGRQPEALVLREETLKLQIAKLGADHPSTLRSMNNLALSYHSLGRHTEALSLREKTLMLMKAKLGPDHADSLGSMLNLAISYETLGRHPESLAVHQEALKLQKAKLGANHPNTVATIYAIARTHALMIAQAEDRGKQADLAMDWLQQAVAAGYKDVERMKKYTDFNPLREREDFKKLIAELEEKVAPKP